VESARGRGGGGERQTDDDIDYESDDVEGTGVGRLGGRGGVIGGREFSGMGMEGASLSP